MSGRGAARRVVDLSHDIVSGRPGYPGLPVPRVEPWKSHAASRADYGGQAEFEITRLFLVGSTGTYLDSPYHRFASAPDIAGLGVERLVGLPGRIVDVTAAPHRPIGASRLAADRDVTGHALLLRTGWDARWGTDAYWSGAPFVTRELAERLVAAGVALVGIDGPNVDDTADPSRPAHTVLLGAGIPIVEHLRGLDALPPVGFRFSAVPPRIHGVATFPVRAYAELER